MITIITILLCISVLGLIILMMLSKRNKLVYNYRLQVLDEDYHKCVRGYPPASYKYDKLPSYETMLYYFWTPLTNENWVGFTTLKDYYKRKAKMRK